MNDNLSVIAELDKILSNNRGNHSFLDFINDAFTNLPREYNEYIYRSFILKIPPQ